ncbi:hypothetical protein [Sphingobium sp.]|uniref:hypothetical protein n=1 Tax=Sphingobium sp. TaxID=1912891 RepID=UPI003B3A253D
MAKTLSDNPVLDIVILTCRPPRNDFRRHLAVELSALGHRVHYIFLKRRPDWTDMASGRIENMSLPGLFARFRRHVRTHPHAVILNSTNLAFPVITPLLRLTGGGFWCFDMHDDLLYASRGWRRRRGAIGQALMLSQSDMIVHAADTLKRLFPRSIHLGNGSHLTPLPKRRVSPNDILILASIDHRFDFDFVHAAAAACPDRRFHVHGWVSQGDAAIQAQLDRLIAGNPNISYHGPYSDDDLPGLLSDYIVAFAPYRTHCVTTEFIDPLRFYHCLASNVALVSTPIPQALALGEQIELVDTPDGLAAALDRALSHPVRPATSWADVARRFETILSQRTV